MPPKGAPNVLLIMTDDQGYGVSGTFGGVIPTPALDRIAKAGLRYTQFHSTALCSPTRAALITGRNHHSVGCGVIAELSTGYPGYDSVIGPENATIGAILQGERIRHLVVWQEPQHADLSVQRRRTFRPMAVGMGFEYFYGFLGGETDQWTPYLFRDHTPIFPWVGKPGYNLTTDMADEAIKHMRDLNAASPDKPFFVYYVPGGTHSPHQPTKEWIDKFKGKFDMGYEKLREQIFANQKRLGVIPPNTQLTHGRMERICWRQAAKVGLAFLIAKETLRAPGGGICRLHRLHRPRDRSRHPRSPGQGQTRQHADHLHLRRQRHQRRRHAGRHLQPDDRLQRNSEPPRGRADVELRRLGLGQNLSAYGGGLGVGIRHALQVDQAGGVAFRRNPAGPGYFVARPH